MSDTSKLYVHCPICNSTIGCITNFGDRVEQKFIVPVVMTIDNETIFPRVRCVSCKPVFTEDETGMDKSIKKSNVLKKESK